MTQPVLLEKRSYANPPIVEAVVELRFADAVDAEFLLEAISGELGEQYAGQQRTQLRIDLIASIGADAVDATAEQRTHLTLLASSDGLRLVGCGSSLMSVHVVAPYPGWGNFSSQVRDAVAAIAKRAKQPLRLSSVVVRYIDRVALPPALPFEEFFTIVPACPAGMPSNVAGFHYLTQSVDEDGSIATLTLATAGRNPNGDLAVLFDLSLERATSQPLSLNETTWIDIIEALHTRQRVVFESSITDSLRRTFE